MPEERRQRKVVKFVVRDGDHVIEELIEAAGDIDEGFTHSFKVGDRDVGEVLRKVRKLRDVDVERVEDGPPTELLIRGIAGDVGQRFKTAAGARGMKYAEYLGALVSLHDALRRLADEGNDAVRAELERLGLGTVSV